MSILDTSTYKKLKKSYFIGIIFIILFSSIYEMFSHGVISLFMVTAFIYPLIGLILILILKNKNITLLSVNLLNCSIATLTFYSIIKGVLDIYGTTNTLINIYLYLGVILIVSTIIALFYNKLWSA